jgi:hypothetical protein
MPCELIDMRSTRTEIRFPVEASVEFWWQDSQGATHHGLGRSRDISEHGAFVFAEHCPPKGDRVELKILIDEIADAGKVFHVHVKGNVLRVDKILSEHEGYGFAVLTE